MFSRRCGLLTCSFLLGAASVASAGGPSLIMGSRGFTNSPTITDSQVSSFGWDNERSQIYSIWGLYSEGYIPIPPYFSLHPPVYYSAPIPRTYGYSPFAYPPGVMTPELQFGVEMVEPKTVPNPYVTPPAAPTAAEAPKTASAPLRIVNPFVSAADVQLASHPED